MCKREVVHKTGSTRHIAYSGYETAELSVGWVEPWVGLGRIFFHFLVRLVGLTHGLGWVGSGWVEIFHVLVRWVNPSVGLGWVEIFFYFLVGWVAL